MNSFPVKLHRQVMWQLHLFCFLALTCRSVTSVSCQRMFPTNKHVDYIKIVCVAANRVDGLVSSEQILKRCIAQHPRWESAVFSNHCNRNRDFDPSHAQNVSPLKTKLGFIFRAFIQPIVLQQKEKIIHRMVNPRITKKDKITNDHFKLSWKHKFTFLGMTSWYVGTLNAIFTGKAAAAAMALNLAILEVAKAKKSNAWNFRSWSWH